MKLSGVLDLLKNDATVGPMIGNVRAYRSVLPRGYELPAIAAHRYGGAQDMSMGGPADDREDQLQLDIYGATADDCENLTEACRNLFISYTGVMSDGTTVYGVYLEREIDMPFEPRADKTGIAYRTTLGFRVVSKRV